MAMEDDFSGFNIDAIGLSGKLLPETPCAGVTDEEFFENFGINPDGTPLHRRGRAVVAQPAPISREFAALQARTMRVLSSARVELEGEAVAALVATLTIASAHESARLLARALTGMGKAIPPADLFAAATLPAAAAGHNLTPKIVPAPRT